MKKRINGHTVEYIPLIKECTYYHKDKDGVCVNCNNTRKYIDGYYLIVDDKYAFSVDTFK